MKLALAALALSAVVAAAAGPEPERPAPEPVAALKAAMWADWDARRFESAAAGARRVLSLSPGDAEAAGLLRDLRPAAAAQAAPRLRERAAAAWRAGRRAQALALLRGALSLQPDDYLSLRDLMWALWREGRSGDAMASARRVLSLRPGDREAKELLALGARALEDEALGRRYAAAKSLVAAGRPAQALDELRALSAARPGRWDYLRELVAALRADGRDAEALDGARRLGRLRPDDPEALLLLGALASQAGSLEEARRALRRSLALEPDQPRAALALGVALLRARDFGGAASILESVSRSEDEKSAAAASLPLGQALFWLGRYDEALASLRRAASAVAAPPDAVYYEGWTLLRLDRPSQARALLEPLMDVRYAKAFSLLLDDALARGDAARALALGRRWLTRPTPADEALALRLAGLMKDAADARGARALLDRLLAVVPASQPAWLARAQLALEEGRLGDAKRFARRAELLNPAVEDWRARLRDVAANSGDHDEAYRQAAVLSSADPAEPVRFLRAMRELYLTGPRAEARRRVEAWLRRRDAEPVLPILLYHGLTSSADDPLLAYGIHQSTRSFADQLGALAAAGYASVTVEQVAAWLRRDGTLPPRPVLITFDDARADSFVLGDPVLARYGFKAAMMAALVNVDGPSHAPAYAPWEMIERYAATGRWEIQAHGDLAHIKIPMDRDGRVGLFLVNRRWDAALGRLETRQEWRARLEADYEACRRRIGAHAGVEPIAYAFPEGAAGQKADVSNAPDAFAVNRALVSKHYRLAFIQDDSGLNTRDRDPYALVRLQPGDKWSGERLVRHLVDDSPAALGDRLLLEWALRERRFGEARRLLDELRRLGASPSLLAAEEASIRFYAGDLDGAGRESARALRAGDNAPAESLSERVEAERRPAWRPSYDYYWDNASRRAWTVGQSLESPSWGPIRGRATYQRAEFMQGDELFVGDHALGAGLDARVGDGQRLSLDAGEHLLTGRTADFFSAAGEWDAEWPGRVETWARGGRSLLYSARAVADGVWRKGADLGARWEPEGPWSLAGRAQRDWYSDQNTRSTVMAEAGRSLYRVDRLLLRWLYRFVYDASPRSSPDYYAPSYLTLHGAGPEAVFTLTPETLLRARYLASRGAEHGVAPAFVSEARAAVSTRWRQAGVLELSFDYDRTPTYRSETVSASAVVRF